MDCDLVPKGEQGDTFKQNVMVFASEQLCSAKDTSVQLMATRTLIRFHRRSKDQQLDHLQDKFTLILEPLLLLLDKAPLECKYLPVEAISTFSKLNEQLVAEMSPTITPKLL
jgi:hypothetical protein